MSASKFVNVALVALFAYCFHSSDACMCAKSDVRNIGCKEEFLAVITIIGADKQGEKTGFRFKTIEDYTPMLATPKHIEEFTHIWSMSAMPGMCGLHFQTNSTYLIQSYFFQGELQANICSTSARVLDKVPTSEEARAMLATVYQKECTAAAVQCSNCSQ